MLPMFSVWLVVVSGACVAARLAGVTLMSGTASVGLTTTGRLWADVTVCPSVGTGVSVTEPKAHWFSGRPETLAVMVSTWVWPAVEREVVGRDGDGHAGRRAGR